MVESIVTLLEANSSIAFLGAFGAGAVTAIAPCSLLSVPLLVGSSVALSQDLHGRKKALYIYAFTALFALGVMFSFSLLGFIVAKFGGFFSVAPIWAYLLASFASVAVALYALGFLGEFDKGALMAKFIRFRLFGALIIGLIFGLVSTPCASAPLAALIGVAANSSYVYAYALILIFALGHSMLLLIAGVSIGFTQSIVSNKAVAFFSSWLNKGFALMLLGFGFYFAYMAYLQS
ncbi:MAG: sulfite exporter TauE/SafE family protein [Epsilonproteobacteria bacterium]|nr:sulfite exporter TauE/SafE family protein [Campylobacterota bacterium]